MKFNSIFTLKIRAVALAIVMATLTAVAGPIAESGDSAYAKKDYAAALDSYLKAADHEGTSTNLYYNIGNTYYRLGDIGHSVIYYERALKLDPSNKDARTNLEFVKSKINGAPEDDSSFLSNLHEKISSKLSPDAWAWMAFALFVIVCGSIALYIFAGSVTLRKSGFFGGLVIAVIFIYVLVIAWSTASAIEDHEQAVVTAPVSNMRSEPTSKSTKTDKVVPVSEGTRLEIIDSVATPDDPNAAMWYEAKLNNTTRAWINAADVERI